MFARLCAVILPVLACAVPCLLSAAEPQWMPPKNPRPVAVVTNEAHLRAEQFLKVTLTNAAPPLTAQAVDAFVTARALYREGHFDACHALLARFWAAHPRTAQAQWGPQNEDALGYKLGRPSVYPGLILLTDAVAGRLAEKRLAASVTPFDWNITCLLVGKARGFIPANDEEAKEGKGRPVTGTIDPTLLANNHAHIHELVWLTREYYRAVTGGKINLRLEVLHLPEVEFTVCASGGPGPAGGRGADWTKARNALAGELRRRTDWYWLIFPEIEPASGDKYHLLSFEKGGTIAGGITSMPGTPNPLFICEDHWLTRREARAGRGTNHPVALEIYFPYWLQHEFFHNHFGGNRHLQLEVTSHAWFKRDNWPKDFVGRFEPDYYHEAMFKRLQTQAKPSLAGYFIHRTDFPELLAAVKPADVVGRYSLDKVENGWHAGEIRAVPGQASQLEWKNDAGKTWGLTLKPGGVLETDARNPYRKDQPTFQIELARGEDGLPSASARGFRFGSGVFRRQTGAGK